MLTHTVLFLSSPWLLLLSVVYQANLAAVGLRVLQQHEAARSDVFPAPLERLAPGLARIGSDCLDIGKGTLTATEGSNTLVPAALASRLFGHGPAVK